MLKWDDTRTVCAITYAILLLGAGLLLFVLNEDIFSERDERLRKIHFAGEYKKEPCGIRESLSGDVELDGISQNISLFGHFDKDIDRNERLFIRAAGLRISIFQNGEKIFSFGENYPSFSNTPGDTWKSVVLRKNIASDDVIYIEMTNLCDSEPGGSEKSFALFLDNIYAGNEYEILRKFFHEGAHIIILGLILIFSAIFFSIVYLILLIFNLYCHPAPFYLAMEALFTGIWLWIQTDFFIFLFNEGLFFTYLHCICTITYPFFILYMMSFMQTRARQWLAAWAYIYFAFIVVFMCLTFFGNDLFANLLPALEFFQIGPILAIPFEFFIGFCAIYEYMQRKSKPMFWLTAVVMTCGIVNMSGIANMYVLRILPPRPLFIFTIIAFYILSIAFLIYFMRRKEEEVSQSRVSVMVGQIKPHFLYNALTSIRQLCDENPRLAGDAIDEFSSFLRGNMESLNSRTPVSLVRELEHLHSYLAIEKLRFGDRLNIVFNLQANDFMIPSLTIQPIVENAIRHGITKKKNGGTVKISTYKNESAFTVTVEDDGKGFDIKAGGEKDGKKHLGIENVQNRLKTICGGRLEIISTPDTGTCVTIIIPKGGNRI